MSMMGAALSPEISWVPDLTLLALVEVYLELHWELATTRATYKII